MGIASGLVIPGGQNLNPYWFDDSEREFDPTSEEFAQDVLEFQLALWAIKHGFPILGICRGMQILAALSGLAVRDTPASTVSHTRDPQSYAELMHPNARHMISVDYELMVKLGLLARQSQLYKDVKDYPELSVNSMHYQGVTVEKNRNFAKIQAIAKLPENIRWVPVAWQGSIVEIGLIVDMGADKLPVRVVAFQSHPEALLDNQEESFVLFVLAFQTFLESVQDVSTADAAFEAAIQEAIQGRIDKHLHPVIRPPSLRTPRVSHRRETRQRSVAGQSADQSPATAGKTAALPVSG